MIRSSKLLKASLSVAALVALSACSVLKTPPAVQTYRFGGQTVFAAPTGTPNCQPVSVALRSVTVVDAARGDRLLAVTGSETAHIGGARWISQAETLFTDSLEDGFAAGAPCIRLTTGAAGRDGLSLSVDVRRLETVYDYAGAVPDVRLVATVQLARGMDRSIVGTMRVDVTEGAGENRVSSIVQAYDRANADAVRQIVEWTAQQATGVEPAR